MTYATCVTEDDMLVGLRASDGIVPDWGGVLENWADYYSVQESLANAR